jgi:hypothetical protein
MEEDCKLFKGTVLNEKKDYVGEHKQRRDTKQRFC